MEDTEEDAIETSIIAGYDGVHQFDSGNDDSQDAAVQVARRVADHHDMLVNCFICSADRS